MRAFDPKKTFEIKEYGMQLFQKPVIQVQVGNSVE